MCEIDCSEMELFKKKIDERIETREWEKVEVGDPPYGPYMTMTRVINMTLLHSDVYTNHCRLIN